MKPRPSRREVLKMSAIAGFGVWVAARPSFAQSTSPSEKLNIATIGTVDRAEANIEGCSSENLVALCDVDERSLDQTARRFPKAKKYTDWRKMLEQKDIDAVLVSAPDHIHAHATIAAMQLGKHVYCEKPLTHSVWEARQVANMAARNPRLATQMGAQMHAEMNYRRVVELLQSGAIGTVTRIHVWVPTVWSGGGDRPKEGQPEPRTLHWDEWIGPAPARPYREGTYHPASWRGWWDFGGGALADMACHHMDLSHWAFGLRYPQTIEAEGPAVHPESCPEWLIVNYRYPAANGRPGIHLTWYNGEKRPAEIGKGGVPEWSAGSLFIGEKGMLLADYSRHRLLPAERFKGFRPPPRSIADSIGHYEEWIRACKEGTLTGCDFAYGGALTESVLLGNVAYRTGKKIVWDAKAMKAVNAPEAERFIRREYRKGWELGTI